MHECIIDWNRFSCTIILLAIRFGVAFENLGLGIEMMSVHMIYIQSPRSKGERYLQIMFLRSKIPNIGHSWQKPNIQQDRIHRIILRVCKSSIVLLGLCLRHIFWIIREPQWFGSRMYCSKLTFHDIRIYRPILRVFIRLGTSRSTCT
jgi:hypothetical protein